ncbi:MAG: hypothetical protein IRY94_02495 [Rhodospirillaceae bacterium]|nr:hypothetical protein [Rhodospirillaceae bacterium]
MHKILHAGVALALVGLPLGAFAAGPGQVVCGDHRELVSDFQDTYKEVRDAVGVTDSGQLLEVLASPRGTWTMLVTQPHGPSCIVATGQSWELARQPGDYGVSTKPGEGRLTPLVVPPTGGAAGFWRVGH